MLKSNDVTIQETMAQTREEKLNTICKNTFVQSLELKRKNNISQSIMKYPLGGNHWGEFRQMGHVAFKLSHSSMHSM